MYVDLRTNALIYPWLAAVAVEENVSADETVW